MPEQASAPRVPGFVLVVDDSRLARVTVTGRLSAVGVDVREANGLAEAASIDLTHVDAALLDLELGDGTGVDVARSLRATHPSLPIAFLTSAPSSLLATHAREMGPVFEKGPELDDAIAWATACCRRF